MSNFKHVLILSVFLLRIGSADASYNNEIFAHARMFSPSGTGLPNFGVKFRHRALEVAAHWVPSPANLGFLGHAGYRQRFNETSWFIPGWGIGVGYIGAFALVPSAGFQFQIAKFAIRFDNYIYFRIRKFVMTEMPMLGLSYSF